MHSEMKFCIVSRIEYIDSKVTFTQIGYIEDNESLCEQINSDYDSTLGAWVETNKSDLESDAKSISEFFDSTPIVFDAKTVSSRTNSLPRINDISELG